MHDPLLDPHTAAAAAGVKVRTVYRWIKAGVVTGYGSDPIKVRLSDVATARDRRMLAKRLTT